MAAGQPPLRYSSPVAELCAMRGCRRLKGFNLEALLGRPPILRWTHLGAHRALGEHRGKAQRKEIREELARMALLLL